MSKELRVISIGIPLVSQGIVCETLETDKALFDFHVVVIRPPTFRGLQAAQSGIYKRWHSAMERKRNELVPFFAQGGVLVVFLDAPDYYTIHNPKSRSGSLTDSVNNYEFLDDRMASCLRKGTGHQIEYSDSTEPFVSVLKKSSVAWTAYLTRMPESYLKALKFFAHAGAAGNLGGKMPYQEGHIIVLPNVSKLDEESFLNVCAEYRFKRQGTTPPEWESKVFMPVWW